MLQISSVLFEEGIKITSIEYSTFAKCSFREITIPNSVVEIGDYAFEDSSISNITLSESLTTIGSYVFYNCGNLTVIQIPVSVEVIGSNFNSFFEEITIYTLLESKPIGWNEYYFSLSNVTVMWGQSRPT